MFRVSSPYPCLQTPATTELQPMQAASRIHHEQVLRYIQVKQARLQTQSTHQVGQVTHGRGQSIN